MHHKELVWPALVRIFDLAEVATDDALGALRDHSVLDLLREPSPGQNEPRTRGSGPPGSQPLTKEQRQLLRKRLQGMAAAGLYDAGVALSALGGVDQHVTARAVQARDRLLTRPEPDGHEFSFGTRMVDDSYLVVTILDVADQHAGLDKMLTVAEDHREAAQNRQDALTAAANLVLKQSDDVKAGAHARSRAFVDGGQDGSFLDAETTNPHPLSAMKIDFGPASLRATGLRLALCSAVTDDDRTWVRDQARGMLRGNDEHEVHAGASALSGLGADVIGDLDATLLAGHPLPVVRQLAAIVAVADPVRHAQALKALAADPDSAVRLLLARRVNEAKTRAASVSAAGEEPSANDKERQRAVGAILTEVLGVLARDSRHTIRRAAAGLGS